MSADVEPRELTHRQVKLLTKEIEFWLDQSRKSKQHQYGVMAAGVAAGIKIAKDRLEE